MRPEATPAFLDAVRDGGRRVQRAYAINRGVAVDISDYFVDYRVTASRSSVARYSGQVTFAPGVDRSLLSAYGSRVQILDGFVIRGSEHLVPVITGRIDEADLDSSGSLDVPVLGLEDAVQRAKFREPAVIEGGSSIEQMKAALAVVPYAPISVVTRRDAVVPRVVYERERWAMFDGDDSLARALAVEVYCDAAGVFIIRDIPTVQDAPVWTVDAGPRGVLVDFAEKESSDGVYSVVVAESDRVDGQDFTFREIAVDDNPQSATYVGGDFGEVVRFYSSPLLTTQPQTAAAADSLLASSRGLARSVKFSNVPNPALEPGDVVTVAFPDGTTENHIIDSITHSARDVQQAQTRTTS